VNVVQPEVVGIPQVASAQLMQALPVAVYTTDRQGYITFFNEAAADLPFRLVESLVNMWADRRDNDRNGLPMHVADACVRVLGLPDADTPALRERSTAELARQARASSKA